MFLIWTLSFLILSYTLGFPILNSTSSGSHMQTLPGVTERNSTEYIKTNQTDRSEIEIQRRRKFLRMLCFLPTCSLGNLGSVLQAGNEIAGDMASDPMGIGKK